MKVIFQGKLKEEIEERARKKGFQFSESFWLKNYLIKLWNLNEKIKNKSLNLKKRKAGMKNLRLYNQRRDKKELCANCSEEEVKFKGEWCDDCNLPERSVIK